MAQINWLVLSSLNQTKMLFMEIKDTIVFLRSNWFELLINLLTLIWMYFVVSFGLERLLNQSGDILYFIHYTKLEIFFHLIIVLSLLWFQIVRYTRIGNQKWIIISRSAQIPIIFLFTFLICILTCSDPIDRVISNIDVFFVILINLPLLLKKRRTRHNFGWSQHISYGPNGTAERRWIASRSLQFWLGYTCSNSLKTFIDLLGQKLEKSLTQELKFCL